MVMLRIRKEMGFIYILQLGKRWTKFHFYSYVKIFKIRSVDYCLEIICRLLTVKAIVIPTVSQVFKFLFPLIWSGEVQGRHRSQVILPHTIPKIPGNKTKPNIWLPPEETDLVAKEQERKIKVEGKEGKEGKKNTDRTTGKSDGGGVNGCLTEVPEDGELYWNVAKNLSKIYTQQQEF